MKVITFIAVILTVGLSQAQNKTITLTKTSSGFSISGASKDYANARRFAFKYTVPSSARGASSTCDKDVDQDIIALGLKPMIKCGSSDGKGYVQFHDESAYDSYAPSKSMVNLSSVPTGSVIRLGVSFGSSGKSNPRTRNQYKVRDPK